MNVFCNNCGKKGHMFYNCCLPITSNGIIAFRKNPETNAIEYLMIRRKHTLGLIDFIRGKYSVNNRYYISNMIYQMTCEEKDMLKTKTFEEIWLEVWGKPANMSYHKNEEYISCEKFNQLRRGIDDYTLSQLVDLSTTNWKEPEWGFPKGRRNYNETDLECSIREFNEETGFNLEKTRIIHNISPFEEIFCGSNYKSYKHKYFLTYMDYENSEPQLNDKSNEVSGIKWKTYSECISSIRHYNLEKKRMLSIIDILLKKTTLM